MNDCCVGCYVKIDVLAWEIEAVDVIDYGRDSDRILGSVILTRIEY